MIVVDVILFMYAVHQETPIHLKMKAWLEAALLDLPLGTGGNVTLDALIAARAIEHGAERCSTDNDFERFAGLRWRNPLTARA